MAINPPRFTDRRRLLGEGLGAAALGVLGGREALAEVPPTEKNILGPYHRKGAPFRTKLSAADEPGEVLIVRGQILNTDEEPLKGAIVDIWQANAAGRYDNDDPQKPPDPDRFLLRGQMKTDAQGRYEFESVVPGRYTVGQGQYRPRHIHYIVSVPGYVPLTTQLYFSGDPANKTDPFIRESLIIELETEAPSPKRPKGCKRGRFNVVLARPNEARAHLVTPSTAHPGGPFDV